MDWIDGEQLSGQRKSPLVETYLSRRADLVRFFTLRLGSAVAAEDLVQELYLKIVSVRDVEIQNPAGYLYRAGSNLMRDHIRGERRSAARDQDWRQSHRTLVSGEEIAEAPVAEHAIDARHRLELIVDALRTLNPQTQKIFRLHKFDGMTHAEVAAALGISRSSVEKHVSAALKRLTEELP